MVDILQVDGISEIDECDFELTLHNGCSVRFQAGNKVARDSWTEHLANLRQYWKQRKITDITLLTAMRDSNISLMHANDDTELRAGTQEFSEFASCTSEPQIYNFCAYSNCRTILVYISLIYFYAE